MSTFDFNTIENYILSPGDIYWVKKSGEEILVSKKGEVPNSLLVKKLVKNEQPLEMRDEINVEVITLLQEYFASGEKELLIQKKNLYRSKITNILRSEYAESERSQFEFDIMAWKIFSKFTLEEQMDLVAIDMDLFKRSLRVTSSLVIHAFLIGYYDEKFLETLFNRTMKLLMNVVTAENFSEDIQVLEKMRSKLSSGAHLNAEVKALFDFAVLNSEVSSWEKLLVIFNLHFSFTEEALQKNILNELFNKKIKNQAQELRIVLKVLEGAGNNIDMAESA